MVVLQGTEFKGILMVFIGKIGQKEESRWRYTYSYHIPTEQLR